MQYTDTKMSILAEERVWSSSM